MHLTHGFESSKSCGVDNHIWNQNHTHTESNILGPTKNIQVWTSSREVDPN